MNTFQAITANGELKKLNRETIQTFNEQLRGLLIQPGDEGYGEARSVWNAMIDRKPALIVRCQGVADVVASVNFAREQNILVSVRGGGHNAAGNAVCDNGLVIDLSPMKSVRVDPETRTARVEPGITLGELDHETQVFGLALPAGIVSMTGVSGLTLGGGWGWLSRTYGLTIDNLLSVDIVTSKGKLLHASEENNADLFWGIRGGGGNFGIVTSFEFQLRKVGPEVLAGPIFHLFEDAAEVFRFHREFVAKAPDELCCYAAITSAPEAPFLPEKVWGTTVAALVLCYSGSIEDGEQVVKSLRAFGNPIADLLGPMPFTAFQQLFDQDNRAGIRNYWKTQLVDPLPDEAFDIIMKYAHSRPTPSSDIVLEHLGGAISRIKPDATAFRHRDAAFSFNIFSRWTDPDDDDTMISWAREFSEAIGPFTSERAAINFLSQEGKERVKAAYGDNFNQLAQLKSKYDPDNFFRMNQNIKPPGTQ